MRVKRNKEDFELAAKSSLSIAGMCRFLGLKPCGGNYKLMHNAIEQHDIDISHFRGKGWNAGLMFKPSKPQNIEEILVKGSTYQSYKLKLRLFQENLK